MLARRVKADKQSLALLLDALAREAKVDLERR